MLEPLLRGTHLRTQMLHGEQLLGDLLTSDGPGRLGEDGAVVGSAVTDINAIRFSRPQVFGLMYKKVRCIVQL